VQQLSWRMVQAMPFFLRPSLERAFGRASTDRGYSENDLYALLLGDPALARDAPRLLLRCGTEDRYRLDQVSIFFTRFLDAVGVPNELFLEKGGHDWAYWKRSFPELVRSVAARLSAGEKDS
jgi:S-formylglutathione hydrolase FrmB